MGGGFRPPVKEGGVGAPSSVSSRAHILGQFMVVFFFLVTDLGYFLKLWVNVVCVCVGNQPLGFSGLVCAQDAGRDQLVGGQGAGLVEEAVRHFTGKLDPVPSNVE